MQVGRPTKLTEEIKEKTRAYIEACNSDYEITYQPSVNKDDELVDKPVVKYNVNLPTIEGLAHEIKVNRDTIYEWCKVDTDYSDIIEDLKAKQAKFLINKGLSGDYNPTIAKVLLSKHGYSEKIETDLTNKGEKFETGGNIDLDKLATEMANRLKETKTNDIATD